MSFLTDRKRVEGLGAAKEGSHHFLTQRITAIALLVLAPLFVIPFGMALGESHASVLEQYAHPGNALVAILFIIVAFTHLKLGLQVVVEDYIHGKVTRNILLLANILFCWLFGLIGIFAIAKIAL